MRLTKYVKRAFVRAVMADVPNVDHVEQAEKVFQDDCLKRVPPDVMRAWKKHPEWFSQGYAYHHPGIGCIFAKFWIESEEPKPSKEALKQLDDLASENRKQDSRLSALGGKLKGVVDGCSTRKMLAERLPEFAKYLPDVPPTPARALPAVVNVAADFVKAGWPKGASPTDQLLV